MLSGTTNLVPAPPVGTNEVATYVQVVCERAVVAGD